ncbi:MAG: nucleotidyl transferase AbiEii/AbiGii toxin family protein [Coriobacteriia bacterium]|nr:nucleotidyl transferase AbiEii/AbiGii toxin family protein [Coriobacteriia bacterium]
MTAKEIASYSEMATLRCERVFASILRAIGSPWRGRICLVGGLVPRYLLPENAARPTAGHVGSTDIDLAISLAVGPADGAAYATLENNFKRAGLARYKSSSWQWVAEVDGQPVVVELLGEDVATESGTLFRPHIKPPAGAGKLELLCVRGVELALRDVLEVPREIVLLDGSTSVVGLRVAGLAPFVALKADAYLDRREPKDVYDLIHVLRHWPGGPRVAAAVFVASPIASDPFVASALERLGLDFASPTHAAPRDYGRFLAGTLTGPESAGMRDEALLVWRQFAEERASLSGR